MPASNTLFLLSLSYCYGLSNLSTSCAFQIIGTPSRRLVGTVTVRAPSSSHHHQNTAPSARRRTMPLLRLSEQTTTVEEEIDLYNDNENGEEIIDNVVVDVAQLIDLENLEDDIEQFYSGDNTATDNDDNNNDNGNGNNSQGKKKKKLIECSASIMLPFAEDVAFDAFADLTRQPSWCKYLHSVEYIGLVDTNGKEDETNNNNSSNVPLRASKWTVGVKGLRFSWTANDTRIVRPNRIEWESTSGMKNIGSVEFIPQQQQQQTTPTTEMKLSFTFIAPRVVSSLFRRSGKIRTYTEEVLLGNMLIDFRDVVMNEGL